MVTSRVSDMIAENMLASLGSWVMRSFQVISIYSEELEEILMDAAAYKSCNKQIHVFLFSFAEKRL